MDNEIANFMLMAAKLEFFLVNHDPSFAKLSPKNAVIGINWDRVGASLEKKCPFAEFDFEKSGFNFLKVTVPQFLVVDDNGRLKWDSEEVNVTSWEILLRRSYAKLRNNIAHGNKAQLAAPFTHERTRQFLDAGNKLITFVSQQYGAEYILTQAVMFQ